MEGLDKYVQECKNLTDCDELSADYEIFLKPVAALAITVTLPKLNAEQTISTWEVR